MPKVYQARWVRETSGGAIVSCEKDSVGAFPALYERVNERVCEDPQYDFAEWSWVADFTDEEHMRAVLADGLKLIPILPHSETLRHPNFSWRC